MSRLSVPLDILARVLYTGSSSSLAGTAERKRVNRVRISTRFYIDGPGYKFVLRMIDTYIAAENHSKGNDEFTAKFVQRHYPGTTEVNDHDDFIMVTGYTPLLALSEYCQESKLEAISEVLSHPRNCTCEGCTFVYSHFALSTLYFRNTDTPTDNRTDNYADWDEPDESCYNDRLLDTDKYRYPTNN